MEYVRDLLKYQSDRPCVVTLGKFDGVHLGHRKLIRRVRELALENDWKSCVFTFDVSPQVCLGARRQKMLMTNRERAEAIRDLDMDLLVECSFTPELRNMDAETFVREILVKRLHVARIVVGTDFHFAKNRSGTPDFLKKIGGKYGFETEVLSKEMDGDREISSTYVREELAKGHMEKVCELLGSPYYVTGTIVHGRHLGHTLGFPTINLVPDLEKMLPPNGVYMSRTFVAAHWYQGISDIGTKPTVDGHSEGVETYLFDCSQDLYGQEARVGLLHFDRPEVKFPSVEALKEQLEKDIASADLYFEAS